MKFLNVLSMAAFLAVSASAQLLGGANLSVIKVGKTEISQGRVDSLTKMLAAQQLQGQPATDEMMQQVRWAVIDNLVGQELLQLEGDRQKISPNPKKVDSLVTLFKAQFPSEDAFQKEMRKTGITMAQFREKVERQIISDSILGKAVPYPSEPTDAEKKAYFEKHKSEAVISDTISGVQIYLKVNKSDNTQAINDKKQILSGLAAQWRTRKSGTLMSNVQAFQMWAAQYSDDPEAKTTGGLMKPFLAKDYGPEFEKAIKNLKVGEVSEVFQTKIGLVIFLLTEKNDGKYDSYAHKVTYILQLQKEQDRQDALKAFLNNLAKTFPVQYFNKDYTPPTPIGAGAAK
ncbi:MAG TPA: peptidylprolyl isomerase [Fibrobacteraceae bacterium]|nr:peptidylprolyl isomerase [Fibrobacteraceae bacterium]